MPQKNSNHAKNKTRRTEASKLLDEASAIGPQLAEQLNVSLGKLIGEKFNALIPIPNHALESYTKSVIGPNTVAWIRITERIQDALDDPDIKPNKHAMEFLTLMQDLSGAAWGTWNTSRVLSPLSEQLRSENASHAASKKNQEARDWVLKEWDACSDKEQGKAAFGRQYARLLKQKYKLMILPETISRDWLPKTKK
jgi:hypothetical protein